MSLINKIQDKASGGLISYNKSYLSEDQKWCQIFRPGLLCLKCYDDWSAGRIDKWYMRVKDPEPLSEEVLILIRLSGPIIINIDPETGYKSHRCGQNFGPEVRCLNCGGRGVWPEINNLGVAVLGPSRVFSNISAAAKL